MRQHSAAIWLVATLLAGCSPTATPTASHATAVPSPFAAASASGSPAPSTAVPATPSPAIATPSVAPTASAHAEWQPVPPQDAVAGTQFQSVVWTGAAFVATGVALGAGGVFLDSPDGLTWNRQEDEVEGAYPTQIAAGPSGVVAVGTIDGKLASWASPDGQSWTVARDALPSSRTGADTVAVTGLVAMRDGWLAVGREDPACNFNCGLTAVRALAWTSPDGLHWTAVPKQRSLLDAGMNAVAAGPPGFVAVGTGSGRAALWTSTDGSTWSRVPDAPMFGPRPGSGPGASVSGVGVAGRPGLTVVMGWAYGVGPGGEPAVVAWWSADGRTWTKATVERGGGGQVFSVAATPGRFLATGPSGRPSCLGGIWSSVDGATWTCEASDPAFDGFGPYAAAGSPTTEVAVGLTSASGDSPDGLPGAAWWRSTP
jgi:hypothetical protein